MTTEELIEEVLIDAEVYGCVFLSTEAVRIEYRDGSIGHLVRYPIHGWEWPEERATGRPE